MKRIILMVGVYDTLDIFTYELKKAFEEMGYETMVYDTSDFNNSLIKLSSFVKSKVDAVITFNNLGFNLELNKGHNLWDELNIPCINILMDHPFCYKNALDNAPANGIVLCVDQNHMKYIQRFHKNINVTGFLPHGGKACTLPYKPISERQTQIIYAGNLSRSFADIITPDLSKYTLFDAAKIVKRTYENVTANPWKTTEQGIEEALTEAHIELSDDELCEVISDLHFVDLYIVSHFREKIVASVAKSGLELNLYGAGWEGCGWINLPNVTHHGKIPAEDVVRKMADSKFVLSTMTWFKDGTHDRIFNGMLNGAVVVSDTSKYMEENFDDSSMVLFGLDEISALPDRLKTLMSDTEKMQQIADKGYTLAAKDHSWAARAAELDRDLISQL